jgi:hypothetical protein
VMDGGTLTPAVRVAPWGQGASSPDHMRQTAQVRVRFKVITASEILS